MIQSYASSKKQASKKKQEKKKEKMNCFDKPVPQTIHLKSLKQNRNQPFGKMVPARRRGNDRIQSEMVYKR